jgi:hypothetical protein
VGTSEKAKDQQKQQVNRDNEFWPVVLLTSEAAPAIRSVFRIIYRGL